MFTAALNMAIKVAKQIKNKALARTLTAEDGVNVPVNVQGSNSDAFKDRMRELVESVGSIAAVARKSGISGSTVQNWVDGISDASRERCVMLARGTGCSLLWLVAGEGPMYAAPSGQSQPVQQEALTMAIQLAAEALTGKYLPPDRYAELVGLIYEGLVDGLPEAQILRFARIAAP